MSKEEFILQACLAYFTKYGHLPSRDNIQDMYITYNIAVEVANA